jgi:hypothetical protein
MVVVKETGHLKAAKPDFGALKREAAVGIGRLRR